MKNNIEDLYIEDEYKNDLKNPYHAYLSALENVFDLKIIDSICDVGTRVGNLLYFAKKKYPKIEITGYDYFEWSKQYAHPTVSEYIKILDLSKPLKNFKTFNLVNCTEVGEHIPKEFEGVFIDNICKLSNDILILSWSNEVLDQHLNHQKKSYIIKEIIKKGFQEWNEKSSDLGFFLKEKIQHDIFPWWCKSIMVFKKKKFLESHSKWFVQGCANNNSIKGLKFKYYGVSLQKQLMNLRDKIYLNVANKAPLSILRLGDGDVYFMHAFPIGSAKPGNRATKFEYSEKNNLKDFRMGIYKADLVTTEINYFTNGSLYVSLLLEILYKIFPNFHKSKFQKNWKFNRFFFYIFKFSSEVFSFYLARLIFAPIFYVLKKKLNVNDNFPLIEKYQKINTESVYALVANRLIFRMFPENEILLVGQEEKINAIKILLDHKQYRDYLGISFFSGFVHIPKVGAADNEEQILNDIKKAVALHNPKIILIGAGSAKLYIIPRIRFFSDAVVIDIGAGVDALAGVISQDRPYFADWINFKSNNINYSNMDLMDLKNPERDSDKYKKVLLNNF
jgi:2-polyprenyl-3-methyl-5-hydroxy-6-metoxy-1,4-benzoquinol methylase